MLIKLIRAQQLETTKGYCFLGSQNFTSAAWGRLVKKDDTFQVSNYELGVIKWCFEENDYKFFDSLYDRPVQKYTSYQKPFMK
jgi:hypothetical protein